MNGRLDTLAAGSGEGGAWAAAMACYRMADADLEALGRDYSDDELRHYGLARAAARDALLDQPAPNWSAFIAKLELLAENADLADDSAMLAILRDARRLAGAGA